MKILMAIFGFTMFLVQILCTLKYLKTIHDGTNLAIYLQIFYLIQDVVFLAILYICNRSMRRLNISFCSKESQRINIEFGIIVLASIVCGVFHFLAYHQTIEYQLMNQIQCFTQSISVLYVLWLNHKTFSSIKGVRQTTNSRSTQGYDALVRYSKLSLITSQRHYT